MAAWQRQPFYNGTVLKGTIATKQALMAGTLLQQGTKEEYLAVTLRVPVWDVSEQFPELEGVLAETACDGEVRS